jgi:hypothetical protein
MVQRSSNSYTNANSYPNIFFFLFNVLHANCFSDTNGDFIQHGNTLGNTIGNSNFHSHTVSNSNSN